MNFDEKNLNNLLETNQEMRLVLENIINGCVHPDVAVRAVMVDLTPIRKALKNNQKIVDELNIEIQ